MADEIVVGVSANRTHEFTAGHRVYGHEGKCSNLHGHGYVAEFEVEPEKVLDRLDSIGRVLDFSVIKSRLCMWLEENWDHRFLIYEKDSIAAQLKEIDPSVVLVPFNPSAEQMAIYLVRVIGPQVLAGTGCVLRSVVLHETQKCSARVDRFTA